MLLPDPFWSVYDEASGVLTVSGSVEVSDVSELGRTLRASSEAGDVTVDLTGVTHLPSDAMSVLLLARVQARQLGWDLHFVAGEGSVARRVLVFMGLPVDGPTPG